MSFMGLGRKEQANGQTDLMVEARGLRKVYDTGKVQLEALKGVDLAVRRGEMVAIMGPSGCGKTTFLNCVSGLDRFDGGDVLIEGVSLKSMSDNRKTEYRAQRMGFVFQTYNLIPVLTGAENVELPLLLNNVPSADSRRRAEEVLGHVGLAERLDHRPAELSGGEQQRVAIARALAPEPAIVWTDEPTGNLDSATAAQVMDLLGGLNAEGLTIVLVTHDEGIAETAHRILTMRDGVIVREDARA